MVGWWGGKCRPGVPLEAAVGAAGLREHGEGVGGGCVGDILEQKRQDLPAGQRSRGEGMGLRVEPWGRQGVRGTAGWGRAGGSVMCEVLQDTPVCLGPVPLLPCFAVSLWGWPVSTACGQAGRGSG